MTDKSKPLSIIDSTQDKNAPYPPTSRSIFNPYTGSFLSTVDEKTTITDLSLGVSKNNAVISAETKTDKVKLNLVVPNILIRIKKTGVLYYKFRLFISFNSTDFFTVTGNKDKEAYCDIELFNDPTGINNGGTINYVAQAEVGQPFRTAVAQLIGKYTLDEIIATMPVLADKTFTSIDEKRLAITENLDALKIYAQIAPVGISPNVTDLSDPAYDSTRRIPVVIGTLSLPDAEFSLVSAPSIQGTSVKFTIAHRQVKSVTLKFTLVDVTGTPFADSDASSTTRVYNTTQSNVTTNGLTQQVFDIPIISLFSPSNGVPEIITDIKLMIDLTLTNVSPTFLQAKLDRLNYLLVQIVNVTYDNLVSTTQYNTTPTVLKMPKSSIAKPSYIVNSLVYNSVRNNGSSITLQFTVGAVVKNAGLPGALVVLTAGSNVYTKFERALPQIGFTAVGSTGTYQITIAVDNTLTYDISAGKTSIYVFDSILGINSNTVTLSKIDLTKVDVKPWFIFTATSSLATFQTLTSLPKITGDLSFTVNKSTGTPDIFDVSIQQNVITGKTNIKPISGPAVDYPALVLKLASVSSSYQYSIPTTAYHSSFLSSNLVGATIPRTNWRVK